LKKASSINKNPSPPYHDNARGGDQPISNAKVVIQN